MIECGSQKGRSKELPTLTIDQFRELALKPGITEPDPEEKEWWEQQVEVTLSNPHVKGVILLQRPVADQKPYSVNRGIRLYGDIIFEIHSIEEALEADKKSPCEPIAQWVNPNYQIFNPP